MYNVRFEYTCLMQSSATCICLKNIVVNILDYSIITNSNLLYSSVYTHTSQAIYCTHEMHDFTLMTHQKLMKWISTWWLIRNFICATIMFKCMKGKDFRISILVKGWSDTFCHIKNQMVDHIYLWFYTETVYYTKVYMCLSIQNVLWAEQSKQASSRGCIVTSMYR